MSEDFRLQLTPELRRLFDRVVKNYYAQQGELATPHNIIETQGESASTSREADFNPRDTRLDIPLQEHFASDAAYVAFIKSLDTACSLYTRSPADLRWSNLSIRPITSLRREPQIEINIGDGAPKLSMILHPVKDGSDVTHYSTYQAPIFLTDVTTWDLSRKLQRYRIDGCYGEAEQAEGFPRSVPLKFMLDRIPGGKTIVESTPVIHGLVLLPIAPNEEYTLECTPRISFSGNDHSHYRVSIVNANKFSATAALTNGSARNLTYDTKDPNNPSGDTLMKNFQVDYVPAMSALERLVLPDNKGHIVLVATPVEKPYRKSMKSPFFIPKTTTRDDGYLSMKMQPRDLVERSPVQIGDVSLSQGRTVGTGTVHKGKLSDSADGKAVLIHLRLLGVKPLDLEQLTTEGLVKMLSLTHTYGEVN